MKHRMLFLAVFTLAFLVRTEAARWNWFMHGDVIDDAVVTASVRRDGRLLAYGGPNIADPAYFPLPPIEKGEALKQHGPLWPILGSAVMWLYDGKPTVWHGFFALRVLSVISGMFLLYVAYLLTERLLDKRAAVVVMLWLAASYVLIDFSGNGSFYAFQGVLYLLWILVAYGQQSVLRTAGLGVITAVAYLTNFQSIILLPATIALFVFPWKGPKQLLSHAVVFLVTFLLLISPWLLRSQLLFGSPLYSHAWNMRYVHGKMGFAIPADGVLHPTPGQQWMIVKSALFQWLPNNLYYAARKLFILLPLAFIFFSYGLIDVAFSKERFQRLFPLLVVLVLHILLSAGWPIWKFRYFVPLLPLVAVLAAEELWHVRWLVHHREKIAALILACIVCISVLTYNVTPAHTTYYDGALTQDPFRGSEEIRYLESYGILPASHVR